MRMARRSTLSLPDVEDPFPQATVTRRTKTESKQWRNIVTRFYAVGVRRATGYVGAYREGLKFFRKSSICAFQCFSAAPGRKIWIW